ncbi:lipoprotein-releasing ABC transporter permease subunit LolE [Candidatus Curculioniphilus buchneri]|uniref:lipoprotein-releasing ABC transporter permease subunit LolE n=1 Tax=Candidatus Curculioniphilus buchneri TaxID=690594 RepID=UPI00376F19D7
MNIPLSLKIAIHFSRKHNGNSMISIISVISTIGIALGVAVLIIVLSAINGFEYELNNRILAIIPHGEIEPVNPPLSNWQTIIKHIRQVPGVLCATPYLNFTGLVEHGNKRQVIQVKGTELTQEEWENTLGKYIINDNIWQNFCAGKNQIIIGHGIAQKLEVKQSDWITLLIPISTTQMKLPQLHRIRLQVRSIVKLNSQLDHNFAIVPLVDAQYYLQWSHNISGIAIKVKDVFKANTLVQDAGKVINANVKVRHWISTYGYMYRDIQMIRSIIYLAMVLMMGIAYFNIIATLMMAVKEKSADIAILRTLGAKNKIIYAIFIYYGLLTGSLGSFIGVIIGVIIGLNLTKLIENLENLLNSSLLSSDVYFIDFLPTQLCWIDVIKVLIIALLLSIISSLYPAWRATLLDPAQILSKQ